MGQVLARVTGRGLDVPRGPDVSHRIRVPSAWIEEGRLIEVELPRHLRCAACDGGGCDACDRSGALTLRERGEPPEVVEIKLPTSELEVGLLSKTFVIRIPQQGGLPKEGEELPRGHLLLSVAGAESADASVRLVERRDPQARKSLLPAQVASSSALFSRGARKVAVAALLVALWIALLLYLRLTGRG